MIVYPNAKINIGLNIVARREDGYHNISTLFYPITNFCDILEIAVIENQSESIRFTQSGITIDCDPQKNLCLKAFDLLKSKMQLSPIAMHLHKIIPTGAGLGGGSADGAFTLSTINDLMGKPFSKGQLMEFALELGSDCPFFIENKPSIGTGRGEKLKPINLDLSGFYLLLVNSGIHVNTGLAYSHSTPNPWKIDIETLLKTEIEEWHEQINNDFESFVFKQFPEIEKIKVDMYKLGSVYAAMSGSGSTVFGIFKSKPNIESHFNGYFVKDFKL